MKTIQIDDQVFDVLQRAAARLVEPSPNQVLRRMLLADPILATLPDAPWPSPFKALPAPVRESELRHELPPIPLGTIPPPRSERAAQPGRAPAWTPLDDAVPTVRAARQSASVASRSGDLPPGLRQAFDVIYLIVRHRVPRPEAIQRVSDLRRAAGAPTHGPRLTVGAKDFDRMLRQRGRDDIRALLKSTFPEQRRAIDEFLDELSDRKTESASETTV